MIGRRRQVRHRRPFKDRRKEFNGGYKQRDLNLVRYFVVHHSGVDVDSSAESVDAYHKSLGWPGIGYHFLVHWDGLVEYVGDISTLRYNVASQNAKVVGVCILGDWEEKLPPQAALDSLDWLIGYVLKMVCPDEPSVGECLKVTTHRRIALPGYGTSCPGSALDKYVRGE